MSDHIVYNHGAVVGFAGEVGAQAAQLMEIHSDTLNATSALSEFFQGHGATAFFDAQQQMLRGLEDMINTVSRHGQTVHSVDEMAQATDAQIGSLFI